MSDDSSNLPLKNRMGKLTGFKDNVGIFFDLGKYFIIIISVIIVAFMIIFYHRYDLLNNYIPNLIPNSGNPTHERTSEPLVGSESASRSTQSFSLRPVYLDVGYDGAGYVASLKQQLSNSNIQTTDDRTRSGITLQVGGDVSVKPGITIGNSQTWRADAMLSLEAFGTQDHSRLFGQSYHGQEMATLPDAARERAVTEAIRQLVADYKNHVQGRSQ